MPNTTDKREVKITVNIRPGPLSPARRTAWRKFWVKLISEVKAQAGQDSRVKGGD